MTSLFFVVEGVGSANLRTIYYAHYEYVLQNCLKYSPLLCLCEYTIISHTEFDISMFAFVTPTTLQLQASVIKTTTSNERHVENNSFGFVRSRNVKVDKKTELDIFDDTIYFVHWVTKIQNVE